MDLLRDGIVKTRKNHRCFGCRECIETGSKAFSQTIADSGTVYTLYMCSECHGYCGNCTTCYDMQSANEGYIYECKKEELKNEQHSPNNPYSNGCILAYYRVMGSKK